MFSRLKLKYFVHPEKEQQKKWKETKLIKQLEKQNQLQEEEEKMKLSHEEDEQVKNKGISQVSLLSHVCTRRETITKTKMIYMWSNVSLYQFINDINNVQPIDRPSVHRQCGFAGLCVG